MKAVILAAGRATRFVVDKETGYLSEYLDKIMLPLGGKPIIEHILNELFTVGIRKFVLVVSSHSTKIPLQQFAQRWESVKKKADRETQVEFAYQPYALGTADALWQARGLLGETFAVFYGDDIWVAEKPRATQLLEAYKRNFDNPMIAAMEVGEGLASRLGVLDYVPCKAGISRVKGIVEKPEDLSKTHLGPPYLATISGMILNSQILPFLETGFYKERKLREEFYLTEALNDFAQKHRLLAVRLLGRWVDCGTLEAYLETLRNWPRS